MCSDSDVVEDAEAHCPLALGVMPGRANLAEDVRGLASHHDVDGVEPCSDGSAGGFPCALRCDRVDVEVFMALFDVLDRPGEASDMLRAVCHGDVGLVIFPERRFPAFQECEALVRQRLIDGPHPVWSLGMTIAGIVIEESVMGDQCCRHMLPSLLWSEPHANCDRRAI